MPPLFAGECEGGVEVHGHSAWDCNGFGGLLRAHECRWRRVAVHCLRCAARTHVAVRCVAMTSVGDFPSRRVTTRYAMGKMGKRYGRQGGRMNQSRFRRPRAVNGLNTRAEDVDPSSSREQMERKRLKTLNPTANIVKHCTKERRYSSF